MTRVVLREVLEASGEPHCWNGNIAWLGAPATAVCPEERLEYCDPVRPAGDGTYDLGQVGWTFVGNPETSLFSPEAASPSPEP